MIPSPAPRRSRLAAAAAIALAANLLQCASRQHAGPEPDVALASSAEAQARFRALREQWVSSPLDARVALERPLTDFVQRHPTDPQGRYARIYLAWISLQKGDRALASRWLSLAEPGAAGSASDLAAVVRAALTLAAGETTRAYRELRALEGRLIDPDDRLLCLDQLVLAALADRRYQAAVLHMLELSAQAARRHRERMWRVLESRLARIPLPELEASLPRVRGEEIKTASVAPAERAAAVDWMRRTLLELLSRSAIDEQNVALAQRLVMSPETGAEDAEKSELLLLATRGTLERTLSGRTLGLAIELGDARKSQRSIDVASGIALTLDLSGAPRDTSVITLTTRQVDGGNMADALARLSGDGASLLVAGFDAEGARAAADFARDSGAPVLLLHEPAGERELPPGVYVLGAEEARANDLLYTALEQRFRGVVRVGSSDAPCPNGDAELDALIDRASSGGRRPRLTFEGGAGCARAVLMRLGGAARPVALGFGLGALGAAWETHAADEVWAVGAGRLPLLDTERDELAARWLARKGRPPTWYEALGHDAAMLAAAAIGPAPKGIERDPERVRAIYREVAASLGAAARAGLWTSDGPGFDGRARLTREFRALRIAPSPASDAR